MKNTKLFILENTYTNIAHEGASIMLRNIHVVLQPLNKRCSREVGMSTSRWFLCYRWVRFLRTRKLHTPWWRHQMETLSALLALCAGNSPVPVNSPHKGQWRGALMFSFIYAWINDWVNNREAGDLRRQDGHYDVIVMTIQCPCLGQ